MRLKQCVVVPLPKIKDPRGNLTFLEGDNHVPFAIRRVYYLYDVPGGAERGGHAHRELEQLIIAINGSFDVVLEDGEGAAVHRLCRADEGLYVCPGIWRELKNFTSGSVCLVVASLPYAEDDYIRDHSDFVLAAKSGTFAR
jgi:hypothetical protein